MDTEATGIIEQVTLRKLDYAKGLLKAVAIPSSGNRSDVRMRITKAVDSGTLSLSLLRDLLEELDVWGNQRIRVGRMPLDVLDSYQTREQVAAKASEAGMVELLDAPIALVPPPDLTPMSIRVQDGDPKLLSFFAAKMRRALLPDSTIPDHTDRDYPGVVFRPFREETQKAISFAEVDLLTGLTIVSVTHLYRSTKYDDEFEEFISIFAPFFPLSQMQPLDLFTAVRRVPGLPKSEVVTVGREGKINQGGLLKASSHSIESDVREDAELATAFGSNNGLLGTHCNCRWQPQNGLDELTHTHIFAGRGEIAILGQVKEKSARYVLRRVLQLCDP